MSHYNNINDILYYLYNIFKKKFFYITSIDILNNILCKKYNNNYIFFKFKNFYFLNSKYIKQSFFFFIFIFYNVDFVFLFDFKYFLSNNFLNLKKVIFINLHPSLLPKYKGCSPIYYHLLSGNKYSGITVFIISNILDSGDYLDQIVIKNSFKDNMLSYRTKIFIILICIIFRFINVFNVFNCFFFKKKQLNTLINLKYTNKILKYNNMINLNNPGFYIECKIRSFYLWPGSFFFLNNDCFKIILLIFFENYFINNSIKNDFIFITKNGYIYILKIQKNNKNVISIYDFINQKKSKY